MTLSENSWRASERMRMSERMCTSERMSMSQRTSASVTCLLSCHRNLLEVLTHFPRPYLELTWLLSLPLLARASLSRIASCSFKRVISKGEIIWQNMEFAYLMHRQL